MATVSGRLSLNQQSILAVTSDPSASTGTAAKTGSFATITDGSGFYLKTGSANTAWTLFTAGGITALTGDVTASGPGSAVATIANLAVTGAKIANATIDLTAKVTGALPIANGGTGQATKAAGFDALSPLTTAGDILYGGASGTGTRLAAGTSAQLLAGGTTPAWTSTLTKSSSSDSLTLNNSTATAGDKTTLVLKAGTGTTSTENIWISYQTNETSSQEWQVGLLGSKHWQINDITNTSKSMLVVQAGGVKGVDITGSTNGGSAASGIVGEELIQTRVRSAAAAFSSNTDTNVTATKLTLTPGDWDVWGSIAFQVSGSILTVVQSAISTTSATTPGGDTIAVHDGSGNFRVRETGISRTGDCQQEIGPFRLAVTGSNKDLFLVANATFTGGTTTIYGTIRARRIR